MILQLKMLHLRIVRTGCQLITKVSDVVIRSPLKILRIMADKLTRNRNKNRDNKVFYLTIKTDIISKLGLDYSSPKLKFLRVDLRRVLTNLYNILSHLSLKIT